MKALYYTGTGTSEIREAPEPQAGDGLSVVAVSHCGICGSDMHAWHGQDPRRVPPLVLGHEAAGVVLDGPQKGARVAINPLMTCGACPACLSGRVHLCPHRELIGMRMPGAFAERVAVASGNLSVIPDDLGFETAALAEPLACAVHAARLGVAQVGAARDELVAHVIGGGAIGLLSALVLRDMGVGAVRIAEMNVPRLAVLRSIFGAAAVDPRESPPDPADIVIDAVGSGPTRAAASAIAKPGGAIVHIGLQDNAPGLDTRRLTLQEIAFLGVYTYTPADFAHALDLLAEGRISGAGWTEERGLEAGVRSFEDIDAGRAPPKIILAMG